MLKWLFVPVILAGVVRAGGIGMSVEKFTISRDDRTYECFPSLTRLTSSKIVLTYRESDSHKAKDYTRIIVRVSDDDGKTFSDRRVVVETKQEGGLLTKWNCPKVQQLKDGRVLLLCDVYPHPPGEAGKGGAKSMIELYFSSDNGDSWSAPQETTIGGIMPDEVVEMDNGDWLLATHRKCKATGNAEQIVSRSKDKGKTWDAPVVIASRKGYDFCEASIIKLPGGEFVCYMRENTGKGRPIYKCISTDNGVTWRGPLQTLMDAGHRPVAHLTKSGKVMITYRHQPGGHGNWAKNTFAFIESVASALEEDRKKQSGTVLPLDHDRSPHSDGGYTGWVETSPGCFLVVNYIVDDAPKAQIRGYRFSEDAF